MVKVLWVGGLVSGHVINRDQSLMGCDTPGTTKLFMFLSTLCHKEAGPHKSHGQCPGKTFSVERERKERDEGSNGWETIKSVHCAACEWVDQDCMGGSWMLMFLFERTWVKLLAESPEWSSLY